MVQAVLDTLRAGIATEEAAASELAALADTMRGSQHGTAAAILTTSRNHAIKALALRGRRAALLAEYGLDAD
ncbi:hypothetical protein ASF49_13945 [Methylobacterium sp. Leaf104]|nr:hypothetical protein ASF49_13945 [Methylobacterium sp. Leaf104]